MEGVVEVDVDATVSRMASKKQGERNVKIAARKMTDQGRKKKAQSISVDGERFSGSAEDHNHSCPPGISVSMFNYSVENHFRALDTICKLCKEAECDDLDKNEAERLSSSIAFVREWRHFNYQARVVQFACQSESSPQGKDIIGGITLPQFSSATVPKNDRLNGSMISQESSKDFVMYVGGSVWALDWCPRVHQKFDCHVNSEFIAVAAHPPESSYHKIGSPLVGRGVIQIWCILNVRKKEEESPQMSKKSKQNPRNSSIVEVKSLLPKKPRGRPRKKSMNESVGNLKSNEEHAQALSVQFSESSSNLLHVDIASMDTLEFAAKKDSSRKHEVCCEGLSAENSAVVSSVKRRRLKDDEARAGNFMQRDDVPLFTENESREYSPVNPVTCLNSGQDPKNSSSECSAASYFIPEDVALPRVVLCLAHNGKVAWDVKWRPSNDYNTESKYRMGYLAVLLGNGALEVWEVPLPQTVKAIYSASQKEGTDPRFVKLEPIFRCLKLKYGDRQSIPLTVEWSSSSPHNFILAGCHDGVVALWKFSASGIAKDTRPLLCFSADTVPIRALAWAPVESDTESANVIVTAGHRGLKFWDIRDPFRPLWDLNPVQRNIYSLDWLPDPRCVIVSFDDGTLRILSLVKAANDVPVTGKPFVGTQQQGFHSYYCSSSAIWSVQVSRLTGMVAYCSADGTVLHFQLTAKAVEKEPLRNRAPHFLCGSLTEDKEATLTISTPLPHTPFPMKKSLNEWGNAPRTIRGFLSESNQAKRAKEQFEKSQTSYGQPLALCYGDDPGIEIGSEDMTVVSNKRKKQTPKSKTSGKKKMESDQELACIDGEPEDFDKGDGGKVEATRDEIEVFPPKLIAMHKVRWNMNKGSEWWLCYGGAAGILRCQEIEKPIYYK